MRRSPLLLLALAGAVAGAAEATVHDHDVAVRDNRYEPATITIAPGEKVRWTNRGVVAHTVTADNGSFEARMLPTEDHDEAFEQPGRYPYHCEIHEADMRGVVIVRAPASSSTTSSSTTTSTTRRSTSTLPPDGSAVTAPGETTTTAVAEEPTTTVADVATTSTTAGLDLAASPGGGGDDTSTGIAAAIASLLLLGVSGGALLHLRKEA